MVKLYTIEDLKQHVLNLQGSDTGNDLKQSTPAVCGFKSSPVYTATLLSVITRLNKNKKHRQ